jgi:hypothetical protein
MGIIASLGFVLFVSKRFDGIEFGGLLGREDPEKNTDRNRNEKTK